MKQVRGVWVAYLLLVCLGCGGGEDSSKPKPPTDTPTTTADKPEPEPEAAAVKLDPTKVGTIVGTVQFKGTPPKNLVTNVDSDRYCSRTHPKGIESERVIVKDGKLLNVVVYVKKGKGLKGLKFKTPEDPKVLNQEGCQYSPHIIALRTGQPLTIKNSDSTPHNIHFLPKKNDEENFSQSSKGMKTTRVFNIPEVGFLIKCDVHPWMRAYLHVFKHPFFDVTKASGKFELKGVPEGEYTIAAWHERLGKKEVKVKVEAETETSVNFIFEGK